MRTYKKVLLYLLIAIGVLGILDTVLVMQFSSGISVGVLAPGIIGIGLILFSILNLRKKIPIFKNIALKNIIIILFCLSFAFVMVIESLIIVEANTSEAENTEMNFVVILGCGIFPDGSITLTLKNRLDAGIVYLERYPNAICIVSGGQGYSEPIPEALAMSDYLLSQGIAKHRILIEDKSTSTKENLIYSSAVMTEYYPDKAQTLALVSSDFHMFRVKFLSKRYSMESIGIPCPTPWYIRLNTYLREFFAIVKSFIFDVV